MRHPLPQRNQAAIQILVSTLKQALSSNELDDGRESELTCERRDGRPHRHGHVIVVAVVGARRGLFYGCEAAEPASGRTAGMRR